MTSSFPEQGVMVGFKGELIHTFNKNENAIHNSTYFEELKVSINILQLFVRLLLPLLSP